jgi:hypothetical protein
MIRNFLLLILVAAFPVVCGIVLELNVPDPSRFWILFCVIPLTLFVIMIGERDRVQPECEEVPERSEEDWESFEQMKRDRQNEGW